MKSVTVEEFKKFEPCWLADKTQAAKLEEIGKRKERWAAVDILDLPDEEVSAEDKLWAVLRPELVEEEKLHEFACRCAEEALKLVEHPDPRSIAAIEAKRKWLRGEISNEELEAARDAARAALAAAWAAAYAAARDAARDAARAALAAAWAAAWAAARDAYAAARDAAWAAANAAAWAAARDAYAAVHTRQIDLLRGLLCE